MTYNEFEGKPLRWDQSLYKDQGFHLGFFVWGGGKMLILTKQKQNGKSFVGLLFTQHRSESGLQKIVTTFLASSALVAGFPNLASLARLAVVLPVTTATVERSFSDMKLIKARLRSRLGEVTLNQTMQISIEGPDKLNSEDLDSIIQYWKEKKTRKLMI